MLQLSKRVHEYFARDTYDAPKQEFAFDKLEDTDCHHGKLYLLIPVLLSTSVLMQVHF